MIAGDAHEPSAEGDSYFSFLPTYSPLCTDAEHKLLVHQFVVSSILSDLVYERHIVDIERHVHDNRFLRSCIGEFQSTSTTEKALKDDWRLDMLFAKYHNAVFDRDRNGNDNQMSRGGDRGGDGGSHSGHRIGREEMQSEPEGYECIIAAIKGSKDLQDWFNNTLMNLEECPELSPARVHAGFLQTLQEFVPYRQLARAAMRTTSKRLILTGHSRGGAIATLVALIIQYDPEYQGKIDIYCFTFGSPLVGNRMLKQLIDRLEKIDGVSRFYNLMNEHDPVPFVISGINEEYYAPCGRLLLLSKLAEPVDRKGTSKELSIPRSSPVTIQEITESEFIEISRRNFNWSGVSPPTLDNAADNNETSQDSRTAFKIIRSHVEPPRQSSYDENDKTEIKSDDTNAMHIVPSSSEDDNIFSFDVIRNTFDIIYRGGLNVLSYHVMDSYTTLLTTYLHESMVLDEMYIRGEVGMQLQKQAAEIISCPIVQRIKCSFDPNGSLRVNVWGENVAMLTFSEMHVKVVHNRWDKSDYITLPSLHSIKMKTRQGEDTTRDVKGHQLIEFVFSPIDPQFMIRSNLVRLQFSNLFFSLNSETILPLNSVTIIVPMDMGSRNGISLRSIFEDDILKNAPVRRVTAQDATDNFDHFLQRQLYPPGQIDSLRLMEIRGWKHLDQEVFLKEKIREERSCHSPQIFVLAIDRQELDMVDHDKLRVHVLDILQILSCQVWIVIIDTVRSLPPTAIDKKASETSSLEDVYRFLKNIDTESSTSSRTDVQVQSFIMFTGSADDAAAQTEETGCGYTVMRQDNVTLHMVHPDQFVPHISDYFSNTKQYVHSQYRPDRVLQQLSHVVKPFNEWSTAWTHSFLSSHKDAERNCDTEADHSRPDIQQLVTEKTRQLSNKSSYANIARQLRRFGKF